MSHQLSCQRPSAMPFLMEVTCTFSFGLFLAKWESFPKERCGNLSRGHLALRVAVSMGDDLFSFESDFFRERRDLSMDSPDVKTTG